MRPIEILYRLAPVLGVSLEDLLGSRRTEPMAWARAVAATLLHRHWHFPACQVDRVFGRSHGFTRNAVEAVHARIETEPAKAREFSRVSFEAVKIVENAKARLHGIHDGQRKLRLR